MTAAYRGSNSIVTLLNRCRELRKDATDAEQLLWQLLRSRQVAGAKFRRQHQFGPYVLDFFCAECQVAIELDGGQHFEPEVAARDAARTAYLQQAGLEVVRFTNTEVLRETDVVLEHIWRLIVQRRSLPSARGRR